MSREVLRAWVEPDGLRVCRDTGPPGVGHPEHVVRIRPDGELVWREHEEASWVPPVSADPCDDYIHVAPGGWGGVGGG